MKQRASRVHQRAGREAAESEAVALRLTSRVSGESEALVVKRRYYVKHDELYAYTVDAAGLMLWTKERNRALNRTLFFDSRDDALRCARKIRTGPRQFGGLGSKARVVSVRVRRCPLLSDGPPPVDAASFRRACEIVLSRMLLHADRQSMEAYVSFVSWVRQRCGIKDGYFAMSAAEAARSPREYPALRDFESSDNT